MRFQNEEKDRLLETSAARAVQSLSPEEMPAFKAFYEAYLKGSIRRTPEIRDVSGTPGFFLWNEVPVYAPGLILAAEFLLDGLIRKLPQDKGQKEMPLKEAAAAFLNSDAAESLSRLRSGAVKKAVSTGLSKESAANAVEALIRTLREA